MGISFKIDKFVLSGVVDLNLAQYVLAGIPDESGSAALAQVVGSAKGPAAIRAMSQLYNSFHRLEGGQLKTFITTSFTPIRREATLPFLDVGDMKKSALADFIFSIASAGKLPIILGGDHSLTYEALRGVDRLGKKFAVVYFDAHPDFRSSVDQPSFATVMYDAARLSNLAIKQSIQVGVRDIEPEEFVNAKESGIGQLTALEVEQLGTKATLNKIKETVGDLPVYISLDLDVVDRAYAPGVSTPSPCGLTSREALFLFTSLANLKIIGFDVVEHVPKRDIENLTANLAARLIIDFVVRHYNFLE